MLSKDERQSAVRAGGAKLPDAYYHMWRIAYSVAHFPAVLTLDAYMNFPTGGEIPWPPGFDWILAGLVRLTVGTDNPDPSRDLGGLSPISALRNLAVLKYSGGFAP